jgi:mRNA interferase RelE/StbE
MVALRGFAGAFRIRVGDYRIVYTLDDGRLLIVVIDVGHRREIYRSI